MAELIAVQAAQLLALLPICEPWVGVVEDELLALRSVEPWQVHNSPPSLSGPQGTQERCMR